MNPDDETACLELVAEAVVPAAEWLIEADGAWIRVCRRGVERAEQGWKLHVSAATASAQTILRRVLPVLVAEQAAFKVAGSIERLARLNAGEGGLSQVGKFITAYPANDGQAVRLASLLDEETHGMRGPAISGDRPLRAGSLVHYRYGAFENRMIQTASGAVLPAIRTPGGELVPDRRTAHYQPPEWAANPFAAEGGGADEASELIGGRYCILSTLHRSPRGAVHMGLDVAERRSCVLKQAARDAKLRPDGTDARDALRHEARVLARLALDPRFPAVFDLMDRGEDTFLAMEHIDGPSLGMAVAGLGRSGRFVSIERLIAWGLQLASALRAVHNAGFAYRDLKPDNVLLGPDGRLRLLDFELAYELGAGHDAYGGTRGYVSPQQHAGAAGAVADDIYALGAMLYFVATGADAAAAPHPFSLLERPVEVLNPAVPEAIGRVIARCLEPNASARWPSADSVSAALRALCSTGVGSGPTSHRRSGPQVDPHATARCLDMARRLGDSLCTALERDSDGAAPGRRGRVGPPELFTGPDDGALLALAELVGELDDPRHEVALAERAHAIAARPFSSQAPVLSGLYVGEGARAAALLRAGQILGDGQLVRAALERGRRIAALPYTGPDLTHGASGRLRLHLLLWDETAEQDQLGAAVAAGEFLLATAQDIDGDGACWPVAPGPDARGVEGAADVVYLGYAHGAAGIGDTLLDLFDATGDERFSSAARAVGAWLAGTTLPALDDGSGLTWPATPGGRPAIAWCHGATGIGRFLLHAAEKEVMPNAEVLAEQAARTVALGTRWMGPCQCHGLAGSIELLLDMAQSTAKQCYLDDARSLAILLRAFADGQDHELVWLSPHPAGVTPGYMLGYAGIATCLLRLGTPGRPTQLGRSGFRLRSKGRRPAISSRTLVYGKP